MLKTRKDAREAGERYYDPGKPCKHRHISKYTTNTGNCYECVQVSSRRWYENCKADPEKRRWQILRKTEQRCNRHGIEFDLTEDDMEWNTHCPVFGYELSYHIPDNDRSPSLDRHDPNKGYVKGNVVVMSMRANRAKWNLTLEEVEQLHEYLRSQ